MNGAIRGSVEIWQERGDWRALIRAPYWVIAAIAATEREGGKPRIANSGGRSPLMENEGSMLVEWRSDDRARLVATEERGSD